MVKPLDLTLRVPDVEQSRLEAIQWVALASMLIDHIAAFFLDNETWMRMVGRLAFPLFALVFAWRMSDTLSRNPFRDFKPTFLRLLMAGLVAEVLFRVMVVDLHYLNIMFTFMLALVLVLMTLESRPFFGMKMPVRWALAALLYALASKWVDYEWSGVAMVYFLFMYLHTNRAMYLLGSLAALVAVSLNNPYPVAIATAPIAVAMLLTKAPWFHAQRRFRYFFYWIYPLHLFAILIGLFVMIHMTGIKPG